MERIFSLIRGFESDRQIALMSINNLNESDRNWPGYYLTTGMSKVAMQIIEFENYASLP